jgi:hypothetical protein
MFKDLDIGLFNYAEQYGYPQILIKRFWLKKERGRGARYPPVFLVTLKGQ